MRKTIPVLKPVGGDEEVRALKEVIESGWWGKGPKVAEFEKKFAEMVGVKYAIAITSNTHGLDLLLKAKGIKNADVISPTMSFMSTGIVSLWNDCTSTLCDIHPRTMCADPEDVKKILKPNTDAMIIVNMAGVPADIDAIREFYDGFIIEDCAHSCYTPGAGTKGDAAVWSFQAVKTMPCGDGGMITTNDEDLYELLKPMTWCGIKKSTFERVSGSGRGYSWDYEVDILGYKCYMIDIIAAIALEQMKKLPENLKKRRMIQSRYNNELEGYIVQPEYSETVQYYCARVPKRDRDDLIDFMAAKKVHTSVHFKPLHLHPILKQGRIFPVADNIWKELISLPCHPGLSDDDVDYIISCVKDFFDARR